MAYRVRVIPKKKRRGMQPSTNGKPIYGLQIIEDRLTRPPVRKGIFSDLPSPVLTALDVISSSAIYPKGAILFAEGQAPCGVFILGNGRVRLSTTSTDGRSIIVRIAEPGEAVGLAAALSGKPYKLTAETLEPVRTKFIPREAFLDFLRGHGDAAVRVAEILSEIYHATLLEVRYLGFSSSTAEKLARFLLDLPATPARNNGYQRATLTLTHREIGEMIGASRETVTRLFAHFKEKGLIEIDGSSLMDINKPHLEKLLDG